MILIYVIILIVVGSTTIAGLAYFREKRREDRAIVHTPIIALERSSEVYDIAQEEARILDTILNDPMIVCTISEPLRDRMTEARDAFYDL